MSNKTCGECKYYKDGWCVYPDDPFEVEIDSPYCDDRFFTPKASQTNGDKIRQMSDEELAEFLSSKTMCPVCPAQSEQCLGNASKVCKRNWLKYLNAPVESEVNNE